MQDNTRTEQKKILILTNSWGHESIARGVKDCLINVPHKIIFKKFKIDPISEKSYNAFYKLMPKSVGNLYYFSEHELAIKTVNKFFEANFLKKIQLLIKNHNPNFVINTYPGYTSSLEKLNHDNKFQVFNIITDPWTFTKLYFSKKSLSFVFDKKAVNTTKKYVSKENIIQSGWFVEEKFYKNIESKKARKQLEIEQYILTFCVTGGSIGMFNILKVLATLVTTKQRIQVIFMCGANKSLFELVKNFSKLMIINKNIKIIPQGYTKNMDLYMKASDLVIGKAGPNTIFESVATLTPFFATSHISGQEDGNLDLIKKYKIGYAEENIVKISKLLKKIIDKPKILKKFNKNLKKLALYNQQSKEKLLYLIEPKT